MKKISEIITDMKKKIIIKKMKKKRKKIIIEEKMKITMKKKGGENPGMHRTYFRDVTSGSTTPSNMVL